MRQIKFRGKRIDNGEWVFGYLVVTDNADYPEIFTGFYHSNDRQPYRKFEVDGETVGQYTGRKCHDKELYANDIIKWFNGRHWWIAVIEPMDREGSQLYAVERLHNCTMDENDMYIYEISDSRKGYRNEVAFLDDNTEIIGNIDENPELLKEATDE